MFKRLMIGLFALSLAAIWISEANAVTRSIRRRSVGFTVQFQSEVDRTGEYFGVGIFGLPAENIGCGCGEVRGNLYCPEDDTPEALLACKAATGDSAALVVALDPDAIPASFSKEDFNFFLLDFGQRQELLFFESNFTPGSFNTISLPAGTRKKPGWHVITDTNFSLRDYVGTWDTAEGKFIPAEGYGTNGEENIQNVSLDSYYDKNISNLEEKTICALWHHDQIKGDTLHGNYYGVAAFKTHHYDESSNTMEVEILNAYDVCGGLLYNDPDAGEAETEYECNVAKDVVFAPAPFTCNDSTILEKGTFPEAGAEINCHWDENLSKYKCIATGEVQLDQSTGEQLCEEKFGTPYFGTFIPINNGCGDYAFTGYVDYLGDCNPNPQGNGDNTCTPINIPELTDTIKCGDFLDNQGDPFAQYGCVSILRNQLPDCFGCGQLPWQVGESVSCDDCD